MIASLLKMVQTLMIMLPNVLVFGDAGLAKKFLDHILGPRDRVERSGHLVGETLSELFPQILGISHLHPS